MNRRSHNAREESPKRFGFVYLIGAVFAAVSLLAYVVFFSAPSTSANSQSTATIHDALELLRQARLEEAEDVLRSILRQDPESHRARDELRWVCFNQFRSREAEAILEDGLRRNPTNLSLAVHLLMSEFRPQNPRESIRYWERVQKVPVVQPNSLSALGYCYWKLGRNEEARRTIETALNARPEDFRLRLLAAEFLLDTGSAASADPLLDSLSAQVSDPTPRDATKYSWDSPETLYLDRYWWLNSLRAESRDDLKRALQHLEQALALRPKEIGYLQRRGTLLRQLGLESEALESFRAANEQEALVGRLTEIVLGNELEKLTAQACLELADICRQRHKPVQADVWQRAAESAPG